MTKVKLWLCSKVLWVLILKITYQWQGLKDKKLRGKIKSNEAKYQEAAYQAARSELLLPEEAG